MNKISNNELYVLLGIIKYNGNIKKLTRLGVTFQDIIKNIKQLTKDNYLKSHNEKIQLTKNGEELYMELSSKYKNRNKDKWIDKELTSKIKKLDIDFIYLPNQDELYF